ncbi:MAG: TerB family tellurite resistance protein [Pseudomonadota bacterium]|nr:TerB family tellurite resistance protein [Pseudomonadota bacterium]
MSGNDASKRFEGFGGALNDIRLLLMDLLGLGKPDPEKHMVIEVFFGLMGYLAKADRLVSSHESNLANVLMDELNLSLAARHIAMEAFDRGMRKDIHVHAELLRFTDVHVAGSPEAVRLHEVLLRLVASDGRLNPNEYDLMKQVGQDLGIPVEALDAKLDGLTLKR